MPVGVILKQSGSVEYIIMYTCVKGEGENIKLRDRERTEAEKESVFVAGMSCSDKANTGVSSAATFAVTQVET